MHRIYQKHHIPPDEVYAKEWRHRKFMYASELIVMDEEEQQERNRKKGGK